MRSGDFKQTYSELVALTDSKPTWLWSALLVAALIVAPYVLNSYALSFVMIILITVVGALGLNILTGYTGLISLGHVGFLVTGAYAARWPRCQDMGRLCGGRNGWSAERGSSACERITETRGPCHRRQTQRRISAMRCRRLHLPRR